MSQTVVSPLLSPQTDVEHSKDLWYNDGTVILQAESQQFRVYGGILAENSPIFRDMFDIPQPPSDVSVQEGCPLVHLQDSKTDLYHFLKALHCIGYFEQQNTNFAVLSGLLRLGMKYDVEYFKQRAFLPFADLFPATLEAWDRCDKSIIRSVRGRSFAVVKLARDTGLDILLPAAMYSSCVTSDGAADILNGHVSSLHAHRAELDPADKIICLNAREALHIAFRQLLLNAFLDRFFLCKSPEQCDTARIKSLHNLINSNVMQSARQSVFSFKFQSIRHFVVDMCKPCSEKPESSFEIARRKLWLTLPSFFSLPDWTKLHTSLQSHGLYIEKKKKLSQE